MLAALSLLVAVGERHRRGTRRCGRRRRRGGARRGGGIGVAFGRGRRRRGRGGARPALAIDLAGRPDRAGQQLRRVAAAGAEIERDQAGLEADEGQHLLGMAALVVGAVGGAAVGAGHDRLDVGGRERLRQGRPREQAGADGERREKALVSDLHWFISPSVLPARARGGAPKGRRGHEPRDAVAHDPSVADAAPPPHLNGEEMGRGDPVSLACAQRAASRTRADASVSKGARAGRAVDGAALLPSA